MALKSVLNAEMKRLKGDAKELDAKRARLTAEIDKTIGENSQRQQMLQDFMDATFGRKKKEAKPKDAFAPIRRRKRRDRTDVKPRVLAAVNASHGGMKRNAIIRELDLVNDKAGHQYVSNTLKALVDEVSITAKGRMYYPLSVEKVASPFTFVSEVPKSADSNEGSSGATMPSQAGSSTESSDVSSSSDRSE